VTGVTPGAITLLGVPANSSGTAGVARAPAVLHQRGLAAALARWPGFTDAGDLVLPAPRPVRGPSGLCRPAGRLRPGLLFVDGHEDAWPPLND
jgi:hypothetical protein